MQVCDLAKKISSRIEDEKNNSFFTRTLNESDLYRALHRLNELLNAQKTNNQLVTVENLVPFEKLLSERKKVFVPKHASKNTLINRSYEILEEEILNAHRELMLVFAGKVNSERKSIFKTPEDLISYLSQKSPADWGTFVGHLSLETLNHVMLDGNLNKTLSSLEAKLADRDSYTGEKTHDAAMIFVLHEIYMKNLEARPEEHNTFLGTSFLSRHLRSSRSDKLAAAGIVRNLIGQGTELDHLREAAVKAVEENDQLSAANKKQYVAAYGNGLYHKILNQAALIKSTDYFKEQSKKRWSPF